MPVKTTTAKPRSGRPPKFAEPRRPITVTLPERTLKQLESINGDRAKAIAKAAEAMAGTPATTPHDVEELEVMPGMRLLVVGPNRYLSTIPGLQLVEIAPGRFLLAFPSGTSLDSLEVSMLDLMDQIPETLERERRVLKHLLSIVRSSRRDGRASKAEILFVQR